MDVQPQFRILVTNGTPSVQTQLAFSVVNVNGVLLMKLARTVTASTFLDDILEEALGDA